MTGPDPFVRPGRDGGLGVALADVMLGYDPDQVVGSALQPTDPEDQPWARRVLHEA